MSKIQFILPIFFSLHKLQVYVFINVCNVRERQRSSGKFRLHKHFMINGPLKMPPSRYFHCSNFKMTFDKTFMKKSCHFLTPSKSAVKWIITENCKKKKHVHSIFKLEDILLFAASRICTNGYFIVTSQRYII